MPTIWNRLHNQPRSAFLHTNNGVRHDIEIAQEVKEDVVDSVIFRIDSDGSNECDKQNGASAISNAENRTGKASGSAQGSAFGSGVLDGWIYI